MNRIIAARRSVIVAADVTSLRDLYFLCKGVTGISEIGAIKLGFSIGLKGLEKATEVVRMNLGESFPVIYDHQKGGNDIPDVGEQYAEILRISGVDAAILFPFAGPATQEAWIKSCSDVGLEVITGGIMTHPKFLVSEGGYIPDDVPEKIYRLACGLGVRHFVVPGNKINWVKKIREIIMGELGEEDFVLYAPGFITQGGDISECGQAAGDEWHAIVGSAIYKKKTLEERRQAAITATRQIAA